jgi:type VI secretion system protein ImpK
MTSRRVLPVDTDALLQDSYLLVVQVRNGSSANENQNLKEECAKQVEQVRATLAGAGMSQHSVDLISHAQCALLDETVLQSSLGEAHEKWAGESLQARFFKQHQGGETLYENIQQVLSEPAPDPQVLTVFQRVLMLGFLGRYRAENDPAREQLMAALNARVQPLDCALAASCAPMVDRSSRFSRWLHAPLVHLLTACVALLGLWWGLNQLLERAIDALMVSGVSP